MRVAALLAVGILVLIGGAVLAATRHSDRAGVGHHAAAALVRPAGGDHGVARSQGRSHTGSDHARAPARPTAASSSPGSLPRRAVSRSTRAASQSTITYTVKPGDTLSGIATWFKLHGFGRLYDANKQVIGSDPGRIFPGERIRIRDGAMTVTGQPHTAASA